MYKKIVFVILFIFVLPLSIYEARADGCMILPEYASGDVYEPAQNALLVFNGDQEDLYIRVNYEGDVNEFAWLVPTPSYPTSAKAPSDIFKELSSLTTTVARGQFIEKESTHDGSDGALTTNVVVHSQEQIGIYEVTVLSASGADGLYEWLRDNGYKLRDEDRSTLDWYVQNEWYFTAMRIDPEGKIKKLVDNFLEIDNTANEENVAEKFSEYYINSLKNKDYNNFKKALEILMLVLPEEYEELSEIISSEDNFNNFLKEIEAEEYTDLEWEDLKNKVQEGIAGLDNGVNSLNQYNDYIEPIKISFKTNQMVYPLKVSQVSTRVPDNHSESDRTNEVLLYVLAKAEVSAPGFATEYTQGINTAKLEEAEDTLYQGDLSGLKEIVRDQEYFLTKMRRDFARVEMDDDLYLTYGHNEEPKYLTFELFGSDTCPHCKKMKDFLYKLSASDNGFKFEYYDIANGENNALYRKKLSEQKITSSGVPLLFINEDYILGFYDENTTGKEIKEKANNYLLKPLSGLYSDENKYVEIKEKVKGSAMADRLKGRIVLKVEDEGRAYYINPITKYSHYLGRPKDAFDVMREQGTGISNADLKKIPIALDSLSGIDTDGDTLPDLFEDAIGTDKNIKDTDNDGFNDREELENGYNPKGGGKIMTDEAFARRQEGRIFLQVEVAGEAWYISPVDGKRRFLGRPDDAFQVMRNLGLGISNQDFENL